MAEFQAPAEAVEYALKRSDLGLGTLCLESPGDWLDNTPAEGNPMKLLATIFALVAAALLFTACTPTEPEPAAEAPDKAEVEAAIGVVRDLYVAATNAGDAPSIAKLYTDDGVRMPPNMLAEVGKEAIQAGLQAEFDKFNTNLTVTTQEIEVGGDLAFGRGSYAITLTAKAGGQTVEDAGKWMNVLRRQADGSWKIARHTWNSNTPLPGTTQ
jgi:uncharacterized protein (TIGR02246 family)